MFDNFKNLASIVGRAGEMKEKLQEVQEELGQKIVEADAGAGAVRVTANGRLEILSVRFDRTLLTSLTGAGDEVDQQMVEDLVAAATNAALAKSRQLVQEEMARVTGGLNIPGLDKLLGG